MRTQVLVSCVFAAGCYGHVKSSPAGPGPQGGVLIRIPDGRLIQGDMNGNPDEVPEREVYVSSFRVERTEVTNQAYGECVAEGVCRPSAFRDDPKLGGPDQPVVGVSWFDAAAYCRWVGRRLLTEAEWERAARGDDQRKWPWSGRFRAELANGRDNRSFPQTAPVDALEDGASPYGVLNLAGNAAEWVGDYYDPVYYRSSATRHDPPGPAEGRERVVKGGSYRDSSYNLRVSVRRPLLPTEVDNTVGFRCGI